MTLAGPAPGSEPRPSPAARFGLANATWLLLALLAVSGVHGQEHDFGFLFSRHPLTLESGTRQEALGPLYYRQQTEGWNLFALPPLFSLCRSTDPQLSALEWDFLYPVVTYDRYGAEYRWQLFQLLSLAGGQNMAEEDKRRLTLFPLYFSQTSSNPTNNYWAVLPIYGQLKNRMFRDEIKWVLFPLYVQTRKRDVVTDNYLLPVVHVRHGEHLSGWQVWPLLGREHKDPFTKTNSFGDPELVPGHDKQFYLWPFFHDQHTGRGSDNPSHMQAFIPLYSFQRSPQRDSTGILWPFTFSVTDDREKKYHEVGAPWPFIVFARGEGKTINRVFPFYGDGHTASLRSGHILWPVYTYRHLRSEPLERERHRVLYFLYSDLIEKNTATQESRRVTGLWPLFTHRRDRAGAERLQVLALLEPFLPENKSIERNYSPLWALWRSEKNPATGAASQSLLWNLYRRETASDRKKTSFLFGLFQSRSGPEGRQVKLFFIPFGKKPAKP